MNLVVTGGCGFVGSNLSVYLKKTYAHYQILALDNLKRRGSELNLPRLREAGVPFVHGDIRNPEDLDDLPPADYIIDASAEPSVLAGIGSSRRQVVNSNLSGTVNCLEKASRDKSRFIFLSTSRVYPIEPLEDASFEEGASRFQWTDDQQLPGISNRGVTEDFPLPGHRSFYGSTKLCSELLLQEYGVFAEVSYLINRCSVLTGPWQMGKVDQGVIVLWLARHILGGTLTYIGYGGVGKQVRDVLHIADFCRLVDMQIHNWEKGEGRIFNVGGGLGNSVSLLELTEKVQRVTGRRIAVSPSSEDRAADIRIYLSDNGKVESAFGWRPEKDIDSILGDTATWITDNADALRQIIG